VDRRFNAEQRSQEFGVAFARTLVLADAPQPGRGKIRTKGRVRD